jgi:hypothetical protein
MTRPNIITPAQARQWCETELARTARDVHQAETTYASEQYQAARFRDDRDRRSYWSAVEARVKAGERLNDAMHAEHQRHGGPLTSNRHGGEWVPVADLDYWRLG